MNYIVRGLINFKYAIFIGTVIYAIFFLLMYFLKRKKGISWKCIPEIAFCIYCVLLIRLVGIFSLHFGLEGIISYNIIPFIGSSFLPVILNFILFLPYGFLLPIVFSSYKWNWKKILFIGALTSLIIELLQMFGGRYAEIDDFLINTFGAYTGYVLYVCICKFKENVKKAFYSLAVLIVVIVLCFSGIYFVGNNSEQLPDGLSAVQENISQVRIYYNGKSKDIDKYSEIYNKFSTQISNCGGHLFKIKAVSDSEIINDTDCFIEVLFAKTQNISFDSTEEFSISDADRLLYNTDNNIFYWGNSDYQYYVDYTEFDTLLEEHRADILLQYQELREMIIQYFK